MAEESTKSPGGAAQPPARIVERGKRQFIITPRRGTQALSVGLRPMTAGAVRAVLGQLPGFDIVRVLKPRRPASALSPTPDEATETYVARIDPDRAELIRQMAPPQLLIEEDAPLEYAIPAALPRLAPARLAAWSSTAGMEPRPIKFRVIGEDDKPVANAGISIAGEGFPQEGRTDKRGEVALPLIGLPGRRARSLLVTAPTSYWDQYFTQPELVDGEVNVVRLRAIDETIAGFPENFRYGWGQLQMGLDRIPETLTGKGVKIAIIDSGADTTHPLLRHIRHGVDLTSAGDPHTWAQDLIGHGSHCAGIIAARDEAGKMMRGFVPEAEVHVIKILPGGQLSSLLEALDYCLELEVDVVNLSIASPRPSPAVEQKLEEAALNGIACIAAAGSSGGPVQYPASSPFTLAVGAIGRLNEYPDGTWDATTIVPNLVATNGIFIPSFSGFGPEIGVCGPGLAIVSTVPGGFEPKSGTSTAAAHVTGLAALFLAHHPALQALRRVRTHERVATLFTLIRSMANPYGFSALSVGAGLPSLHGLEHVLQPGQPGQRMGNVAMGAVGPSLFPAAEAIDPTRLAPLYVQQGAVMTQAWPVQALLESFWRQHMGN